MFGIAADSPGLWENRCQLLIDPKEKRLVVYPGDGRDAYDLLIQKQAAVDRYRMDGWQSLAPGETRHYTTWVFGSAARSHYDAQLAAHLAVANGKGWNSSSIEAILRSRKFHPTVEQRLRDAAPITEMPEQSAGCQSRERVRSALRVAVVQLMDSLKLDAQRAINAERTKAIAEIKGEAAKLSIAIAEKLLNERLDDAKHQALAQQFVQDLGKKTPAA
jgi:hypothetical protein